MPMFSDTEAFLLPSAGNVIWLEAVSESVQHSIVNKNLFIVFLFVGDI
jgi:hypothetical protein